MDGAVHVCPAFISVCRLRACKCWPNAAKGAVPLKLVGGGSGESGLVQIVRKVNEKDSTQGFKNGRKFERTYGGAKLRVSCPGHHDKINK